MWTSSRLFSWGSHYSPLPSVRKTLMRFTTTSTNVQVPLPQVLLIPTSTQRQSHNRTDVRFSAKKQAGSRCLCEYLLILNQPSAQKLQNICTCRFLPWECFINKEWIAWNKEQSPTSKICETSHALNLLYQSNNQFL